MTFQTTSNAALTPGTAKTATPSPLCVYAALYLSEAAIAPLQLLADTREKRKIAVLIAMKEL